MLHSYGDWMLGAHRCDSPSPDSTIQKMIFMWERILQHKPPMSCLLGRLICMCKLSRIGQSDAFHADWRPSTSFQQATWTATRPATGLTPMRLHLEETPRSWQLVETVLAAAWRLLFA